LNNGNNPVFGPEVSRKALSLEHKAQAEEKRLNLRETSADV
jgi:hypothetical protein